LINKIFDKIRFGENAEKDGDKFEFKLNYPKTIGGFKVVSVRDLTIGYDSNTVDNIPELPSSKSTQMVTFKLENECLITLRTSGTEPKIKYYTELKMEALDLARETLGKIVLEMCEQLLQPGLNKIKMTK
jgi:phosphoglucomutase